MARVLHEIEKKIIGALGKKDGLSTVELCRITSLGPDQIRRGTEWLRLKGLVRVERTETREVSLGKNGLDSLISGLPERRLLDMLEQPRNISYLEENLGLLLGPALGAASRGGWITKDGGTVSRKGYPKVIPGEALLRQVARSTVPVDDIQDVKGLEALLRRPDYIRETVLKSEILKLEKEAPVSDGIKTTDSVKVKKEKNISVSDTVKVQDSLSVKVVRAIDVEAGAPRLYPAKRHPLKDVISEVREAFVRLGFLEIARGIVQPAFWNFDALFTPQDHPAREMQDTFYLEDLRATRLAPRETISAVAACHEKNWRYKWEKRHAHRTVLRTHTTTATIQHLAERKTSEERIFSLGRVFRNEKTSYKHLVEFHQAEGIVIGKNATLRGLMGIQREFYRILGLRRTKFWPTFFPYTEPSLQTMVYDERHKRWVELFGMGILRPEVTVPLGIKEPVLAWGGGIERIAMLKYDMDDVREFYNNHLGWLRSAQCR